MKPLNRKQALKLALLNRDLDKAIDNERKGTTRRGSYNGITVIRS